MIELIVGLGNPGQKYEKTRHNIGQMVLENMPFPLTWQSKFKGQFACANFNSRKIYFLCPTTFMNLSGESISAMIQFFKISAPEKILIVHDELDIPFGTVVLKKGGGLAGHNGLKSIAAHLGSQEFCRLRMGISRPELGSVADYVLNEFGFEERPWVPSFIELGTKVIVGIIEKGYQEAANRYSKKSVLP